MSCTYRSVYREATTIFISNGCRGLSKASILKGFSDVGDVFLLDDSPMRGQLYIPLYLSYVTRVSSGPMSLFSGNIVKEKTYAT